MELLYYASRQHLRSTRVNKRQRHRRAYFRLEYRNRYPDPEKYY